MVGFLCRSLWRHVLVITCGLDLTEDKERRSDQSIDGLVLCYLRGFHCHQSHQTAHSAEPKHFFSHSFCLRHHDELYWHGNLNIFQDVHRLLLFSVLQVRRLYRYRPSRARSGLPNPFEHIYEKYWKVWSLYRVATVTQRRSRCAGRLMRMLGELEITFNIWKQNQLN